MNGRWMTHCSQKFPWWDIPITNMIVITDQICMQPFGLQQLKRNITGYDLGLGIIPSFSKIPGFLLLGIAFLWLCLCGLVGFWSYWNYGTSGHQKMNGTESQRTPFSKLLQVEIRYSGLNGVRGPWVLLETSWIMWMVVTLPIEKNGWTFQLLGKIPVGSTGLKYSPIHKC